MSLTRKNRVRTRRSEKFDEDNKVLIVTLLFCLAFASLGFRQTLEPSHIYLLALVQFLMVIAIGEIRGITWFRLPSLKFSFYFFLLLFINFAARHFAENVIDVSLLVSQWLRSFPSLVSDSQFDTRPIALVVYFLHFLTVFVVAYFVARVIDLYCTERKHVLRIKQEKLDAEFQVVSHLAHNIKPKLGSAQSVLNHLRDFVKRAGLGEQPLQEQFYEGQVAESVADAIQKAAGALGQVNDEIANIRDLITEDIRAEDFQTVDLKQLFEEEILPGGQCDKDGFQIQVDTEPRCRAKLHKHSFVESMINLIRNAQVHGFTRPNVRYTIRFEIKKRKGGIVVDYMNNGEPLPAEVNQANLLLYGVKSVESPGSGLGMAYVGKMVQAHQGSFEILDDPDFNVHFRIVLPKGGKA